MFDQTRGSAKTLVRAKPRQTAFYLIRRHSEEPRKRSQDRQTDIYIYTCGTAFSALGSVRNAHTASKKFTLQQNRLVLPNVKCSLLEATGCGQRQCGHARRGPWRRRRRRQRRGSITLASSLTLAKTSAAPRSFNGGGSSTPLYDAARRHLTAAARCNATPRNTTPRSRRSHRQRQPPPIERSTVTACPRRSKLGSGATLMAQVNSERQNVSTPEAERDGAIGKGRGRSPLAAATS